VDDRSTWLEPLLERLGKIETMLGQLVSQRTVRDWYEVEEVAAILGKAPFTVREWCRHRRVNARKKHNGRGKYCSWVISHEELLRIQREGLLPMATVSTRLN
jgi:hypothetical protein